MNEVPQHTIFVYGTLKRGGRLNYALKGAKYRGEAAVKGLLYVTPDGWFPRLKPGNGIVHGELFSHIADPQLRHLDMIEGHPHLFKREYIKTEAGETVWAYLYVPSCEGMTLLPKGEFDVHTGR